MATGALLASLVLLAGCSDPLPQLARLPNDAVILAFGDSITAGNGAGPQDSYPAVLSELTGHTVINAGSPGEVSASGRKRLPALLERHRPGLLILCHGGNDLLRKFEAAVTYANLDAMINIAHAQDIPVMLIGVPQPGLFMLESADLYDEIAARHRLLFDGDILPAVYSDNALKADHIHPNAAGYRRIAETIFKKLRTSGAL